MGEGHLLLKNSVFLWLQGNVCISSWGIAFPDPIGFCLTSVPETHRSSPMCWIAWPLQPESPKLQYWLSQVLPPDVPEVCYHWQPRTKESSPERHRPDEERFSKYLQTFTHKVAQEIFSNACLQPDHGYCVEVCSHASQPICFRASVCCWREWKRGLQTPLGANQFTTSDFPEYGLNDRSQILPQIQVALFCGLPDTYMTADFK